MTKHLRILLTGLAVIVPFAITVWVITSVIYWLNRMGTAVIQPIWDYFELDIPVHGLGVILLVALVYFVGLMMHFWLFRGTVNFAEKLLRRVPGVKVIYDSVRDLMKLFGSDAKSKMGRVVEYKSPQMDIGVLGILTNEHPEGCSDDKVALYIPLSYMIGGPVIFVSREHLREVDMTVERALRVSVTAQVSVADKVNPLPEKQERPHA